MTAGERVRVLVVEDDRDHAALIQRTLLRQEPPFEVTVVGDGPACLEALTGASYSLVLLDYSLPGMSGLEVLERIRQRGLAVPIVMVTGQGDERVAVQAMKLGGTDYVLKTLDYLAALPTVLYKVLQQHQLARENARLFRETQQALADLKAAQERLVRMETFRALGELANGVAHHMNNLLAIIAGRAEFLLAKAEAQPLRRPLESISRAAAEGAEVVRRIQEFSRMKQVQERQPVDLNELVREVVAMTRVRWRDAAQAQGVSIDVLCELGPIPVLAGQAGALREVVMGLVFNAIDALPDGGRITIRTRSKENAVILSVADNGIGMSRDVLRRAQEPFFTTKGLKSIGLGLSVSYSILQRHGGELVIESAPGEGTTATIRLPVNPATVTTGASAPPPSASLSPLRILVIDDEEDVRDMLVDLVELQGHSVTQVEGPREALALLEAGPLPDVVLTDQGMPEMNGSKLAALVKSRWPELSVGLVTGWGLHSLETPGEEAAVDFILAKPVSGEDLQEKLARVRPLRGPPGPRNV